MFSNLTTISGHSSAEYHSSSLVLTRTRLGSVEVETRVLITKLIGLPVPGRYQPAAKTKSITLPSFVSFQKQQLDHQQLWLP